MEEGEALHEDVWRARREADEAGHARARQLLEVDPATNESRFQDATMETAYQTYVTRKNAAKEIPRPRDEWKVQSDYWQNDSPTARGNRFNEARKYKYDYHELSVQAADHLEGGRAKRVDSYQPHATDPSQSEIISRKATDFDAIEEQTFRDYLKEMKKKYAPKTPITSVKYAKDFPPGSVLEGQLILEVPESNKSDSMAAIRMRFEAIAAIEGIKIRYAPE